MLGELETAFIAETDSQRALSMKAYMKGQFNYYGIASPIRKDIQKALFSKIKPGSFEELLSWATLMWAKPQREWHYAAIDLLSANKKLWKAQLADHLEYFLLKHAWWDSVDGLCSQVIAPFFKKFPDLKNSLVDRWKYSDNLWLRRVSIIHQLKLKGQTNLDLLTECILLNNTSREFFLQKAIGWALREYAKTDPEWVLRFVEVNDLKPLSKREAIKNIRS